MLSKAGVALIELYQRQLSPRKGFRCAYGSLYGSGTCSSIGKQIMREDGIFAFLRLMPEQFASCRAAAAQLRDETEEDRRRRRQRWRDHIDSDCCDDVDSLDCPAGLECGECPDIGGCDFSGD